MNDKKTIAQFTRYMKQNRAWTVFKINLKDWCLHEGVNVSLYLKECPPELYVSNSFSWRHSLQGCDYWLHISIDWYNKRFSNNN